jgi:hypothetical protein
MAPAFASVGRVTLDELVDAPGELYVATLGVSDRRVYALNFGRFAGREVLEEDFDVELTPSPGSGLDVTINPNLFEHAVAMMSMPVASWNGLGSKPCPTLRLATQIRLDRVAAGQAQPGKCPMQIFLNAWTQSARFLMHEWMHIDAYRRDIAALPGFESAFGDPHPKECKVSSGCGGDACAFVGSDVADFDDPDVIRWSDKMVCKDGRRPQGGVFWYEMQSAEHAFIETAVRYRWHGDELRSWAARDAARGNTQLKTRYDWLKSMYFNGQEYNGWASSGIPTTADFPSGDRSLGFIGRPTK